MSHLDEAKATTMANYSSRASLFWETAATLTARDKERHLTVASFLTGNKRRERRCGRLTSGSKPGKVKLRIKDFDRF